MNVVRGKIGDRRRAALLAPTFTGRERRRAVPGSEPEPQKPNKPVDTQTEESLIEEIFLKNAGTGLYRKGLSRRRKALKEVKGYSMSCRDKDMEVTVTSISGKKDPKKD